MPPTAILTLEAYVAIVRLSQRLDAEASLRECLRAPKLDNATAQTAVETVRPQRNAK